MSRRPPSFTIGIEEEYLLVDQQTGDLATDPPKAMVDECQSAADGQFSPELMRSQIEVGTKVCESVAEARADLARLRNTVIDVAAGHGLAPIAASTHPSAHWWQQKPTEKDRYQALADEMQTPARRLLICGMHVHVGIDDDAVRIDLMNQMSYFLPHLLALSTSSPFWDSRETGLKSYRLTVFDALPRTGLPERFSSFAEYNRHVDILRRAGLIEDSSKIWWDMRPSNRYPTLETRVMDVCTRLDEAVSLAALVQCLLRMLYRLRENNQRWRVYTLMLIRENRWRAIRYGTDAGMVDLAKGDVVPFATLLDEIIDMVAEDADALGCTQEIRALRHILRNGTSAHRQVATYQKALTKGCDSAEALRAVNKQLIAETREHRNFVAG
ncbi:MAG: carboxylate-amine ligase [Pseudomonadota bacterium]